MSQVRPGQKCADCFNYVGVGVNPQTLKREGECHAKPPEAVALLGPEGFRGAIGYWPPVQESGWCAAFRASLAIAELS